MGPELIDDWEDENSSTPTGSLKAGAWVPAPQRISAQAIQEALAGFEPHILTLHCYEDVGYPWVQVVFDTVIPPSVALRLGEVLADLAGKDLVYLNSLRPSAVYFVLEPALDSDAKLEASRYGARLEEIKRVWTPTEKGTRARGLKAVVAAPRLASVDVVSLESKGRRRASVASGSSAD